MRDPYNSSSNCFPTIMVSNRMMLFFKTDSGVDTCFCTASLSQNTFAGSSITNPNILNLYRRYFTNSTPILNAQNSAPKVLTSTVGCFLLYHIIGDLLININSPV